MTASESNHVGLLNAKGAVKGTLTRSFFWFFGSTNY